MYLNIDDGRFTAAASSAALNLSEETIEQILLGNETRHSPPRKPVYIRYTFHSIIIEVGNQKKV